METFDIILLQMDFENDYIEEYENTLDKSICDEIIEKFEKEENKKPGITFSGLNKNIKNTFDFHLLDQKNEEWIQYDTILFTALNNTLKQYRDKYDAFKTFENIEDTGYQIQKYIAKEGFYSYHHDSLGDKYKHRILTFLFYLNDVEEGGETEFFYGKKKVIPKAGKLLLFPSLWTFPHCGKMPISNDKYIITGWLYAKQPN